MPDRRYFGLLARREAWFLTRLSLFSIFAGVLLAGWLAAHCLFPFLSASDSRSGEILVVDAWMPTYDLILAANEYRVLRPSIVLAIFGTYKFDSSEFSQSRVQYAAGILARFGIPKERLHVVLFPGSAKNRTYSSALAVKNWLLSSGLDKKPVELLTTAVHARRSRLLYKLALGSGRQVSVVGLDDPLLDGAHWWRSSEGISELIAEFAAYLYTRIVFYPEQILFPS